MYRSVGIDRPAISGIGSFSNPCGGRRWRTEADGTIAIEGEGASAYKPGTAQFRMMDQTWKNWKPFFIAASREYDVPLEWLLAIATVETGLWSDRPRTQETIRSYAGAIGVMQVMPATARMLGYEADQMLRADTNIMASAKLVDKLRTKYKELPAISAVYNSGRLCSAGRNEWNLFADGNYPRKAIMYNNAAHTMDLGGLRWPVIAGIGIGIAGVGAAAAITLGYLSLPS
jgi:hypothetical protein